MDNYIVLPNIYWTLLFVAAFCLLLVKKYINRMLPEEKTVWKQYWNKYNMTVGKVICFGIDILFAGFALYMTPFFLFSGLGWIVYLLIVFISGALTISFWLQNDIKGSSVVFFIAMVISLLAPISIVFAFSIIPTKVMMLLMVNLVLQVLDILFYKLVLEDCD